MHSQTRKDIEYIVKRNKYALQDSLFVSNKIFKYHKDTKFAYDICQDIFHVNKYKSKKILQEIKRTIYIPEAYNTNKMGRENTPNAQIKEIQVKDMFSSNYFHFEIDSI
jgi:hypothetical protein